MSMEQDHNWGHSRAQKRYALSASEYYNARDDHESEVARQSILQALEDSAKPNTVIDHDPLVTAIKRNDYHFIHVLIDYGARLNIFGDNNAQPQRKISYNHAEQYALDYFCLVSAKNSQYKNVKDAFARGANINRQDVDGNTALIYLLKVKHREEGKGEHEAICQILSDNGADFFISNLDDESPYTLAYMHRNPKIFEIFSKKLVSIESLHIL